MITKITFNSELCVDVIVDSTYRLSHRFPFLVSSASQWPTLIVGTFEITILLLSLHLRNASISSHYCSNFCFIRVLILNLTIEASIWSVLYYTFYVIVRSEWRETTRHELNNKLHATRSSCPLVLGPSDFILSPTAVRFLGSRQRRKRIYHQCASQTAPFINSFSFNHTCIWKIIHFWRSVK